MALRLSITHTLIHCLDMHVSLYSLSMETAVTESSSKVFVDDVTTARAKGKRRKDDTLLPLGHVTSSRSFKFDHVTRINMKYVPSLLRSSTLDMLNGGPL